MRIGEFDSTSGRKLILKKDDIFFYSQELENLSFALNIRILIYSH